MKSHRNFVRGTVALALILAAGVTKAVAQSPTPEGTVISNVSWVTYTDANGGTYTPQSATASVTVAFVGGITFTGAATAAPASPSTADTMTFTYTNIGNGNDSLRVTENISVAGVITVTGYRVSGTTYGSLAALNAALSGILVAQNGTLVVKVVYDVASNKGGVLTNYTLTGFSRRDASKTQAALTAVTPAMTASVAVTPDGSQNLTHLPSNGTNYTFTFTVTNNGNGADGFNLVASHPGSPITIVSVNGVAGSSTSITGVAAGAAPTIAVIYSIANAAAAGTKDTVVLTATSQANGGVSNAGFADITVIRPAVAIAKVAYRDDQTTAIGAGTVIPDEYIYYKITVTNSGAASGSSISVADTLPAQLTYVSTSPDAAGWTLNQSSGIVTGTLSGTLAASGGSRYFWIRVRIK